MRFRGKKLLTDIWFNWYVSPRGLCSLCGNSGKIDTRGVRSAAGVECGGINFCICPNGQIMRHHTEKNKSHSSNG